MRPTVSIIVPARNAGPELGQLLERVSAQKCSHRPEIMVIDSGSSDGTPDVARRFGANVVEIPTASFNHGLTRNLGIQHSQGEICVLLVQDALPIADHWLEALIQHFDGDPLICGVTTRQIPRPETDIVAQWEVVYHNNYLGSEVKIRSIPDWSEFERLPMQDRLFMCNFDNVCSAIRRSAWETHPFRSLPFAEDLDWAVRVLRAGNKIVYEPAAAVIHSHVRPAIYHLRRQYISAKVVPAILQCPIPSTFSSNDEQFFAAVNDLIQEAFSFSLLLDQLDSSITYTDWQQWVKCAERVGLADGRGARTIRDLTYAYTGKLGSWLPLPEKFKSSLRFRVRSTLTGMRENPMRAHFFFLLSEVTQDVPELNAAALHHVIVHCLARTLGGFMGSYYLWLDRWGQVSPQLQVLDDSLCVGV
jgi:rhamnosyltransferase